MSAWLNAKADQVCPRCGAPSAETSVLCEPHRVEANARRSRWAAKHRPARRRDLKCAFCDTPSATYRCPTCQAKRRRWDSGLPLAGPATVAGPGPELEREPGARLEPAAPPAGISGTRDEQS